MIIYEDSNTKMDFDEDAGCLWLTWEGRLEKEESEKTCEKAMELLEYYHLQKILVDNETVSPSPAEVMEWFNQMALGELKEHGIEAVALVNHGEEKGELSSVLGEMTDEVVVRSFSDTEEAEQWLETR